jgi:predicted DNA-binding protein (MmcQ/YjbR family)
MTDVIPAAPLSRLREICLAFPEATEKETWEAPTFRVRDKIFAMVHPVNGAASFWCKAPPGAQTILVNAAPERFFVPPYVGRNGWIGVWLDAGLDWDEVRALVRRSYGLTAPRRLVAQLG